MADRKATAAHSAAPSAPPLDDLASAAPSAPLLDDLTYFSVEKKRLVRVADPQSKRGSVSGFTDYSVSTLLAGNEPITVRRRYSHFYWLREALQKTKPGFPVPSLPPKSRGISFKKTNVNRIGGLEMFINTVLFEPGLARTKAFKGFITFKGDFKEWQRKHEEALKTFDEITILTKSYPTELKVLANYKPPTQSDSRAIDNVDIIKITVFLKEYLKCLQQFVSEAKTAINRTKTTLNQAEDVKGALDDLNAQESVEPTKPADYERFDLGPIILKWKAIEESRTDSIEEMIDGFVRDIINTEGMLDAVAYRTSVAKKYKSIFKINDKWKAKPPKDDAGQLKKEQDEGRLRDLTTALDITDRVFIQLHTPKYFQDIQERFTFLARDFIKNQLHAAENLVKFWHEVKASMEEAASPKVFRQ